MKMWGERKKAKGTNKLGRKKATKLDHGLMVWCQHKNTKLEKKTFFNFPPAFRSKISAFQSKNTISFAGS